jgi:hypothetical protein
VTVTVTTLAVGQVRFLRGSLDRKPRSKLKSTLLKDRRETSNPPCWNAAWSADLAGLPGWFRTNVEHPSGRLQSDVNALDACWRP